MTCEEGAERSEKDIVLASRLSRWQGGKHERRRVPNGATPCLPPGLAGAQGSHPQSTEAGMMAQPASCVNRLSEARSGGDPGSKTLLPYRIVQPTRPIREQKLTGP